MTRKFLVGLVCREHCSAAVWTRSATYSIISGEPMPAWIEVGDFSLSGGWKGDAGERARFYCQQLEQNQILFFSRPPFELCDADREFLVAQRQANSPLHKNVSYRPETDVMRGAEGDDETRKRLQRVLREYSASVTRFISQFLAPYAGWLLRDYASFRPQEEEGRGLPLHKRNDLLHVDAFPSRPTRGGRILRVFTNLHATKPRVWVTTDRFPALAERFAADAGLPRIANNGPSRMSRRMIRLLRLAGLHLLERSAYDRFMLRFHDYLKENAAFQSQCEKTRLEFPPMSTWLVCTDGVPHAVLSGQFALEQTYIVPPDALVAAPFAPIRVLEKLCGRALS